MEVTGAGPAGGNALVLTFDTSYFSRHAYVNRGDGDSGLCTLVNVATGDDNWVNTTNLGLYKLYITAKTTGLAVHDSKVTIQWEFVTPKEPIMTVDMACLLYTSLPDWCCIAPRNCCSTCHLVLIADSLPGTARQSSAEPAPSAAHWNSSHCPPNW